MDNLTISFILNGLLGIVMYFMQQNSETLKERLNRTEDKLNEIEKTTVKKEDFREFKEELWVRFDKMEFNFEKKLGDITKWQEK